jgi:hypothetical protein
VTLPKTNFPNTNNTMKIARLNFHDLTGLILEKDSLNIYLDVGVDCVWTLEYTVQVLSLFGWLVADDWCWFVLREEYCWLVTGGWFVVREKYCCLVADKPSEQGVRRSICRVNRVLSQVGPSGGWVVASWVVCSFQRKVGQPLTMP